MARSKKSKSLINFRSKFEETIWDAAGRSAKLAYEPDYIPYIMRGSYLPDFIILKNGIIIEAKGYLDAAACKKMLAVKRSNPDLDIRFVFQNANGKRNKRAKLRNWEWAEKHGFPWSEGTIPQEWLKEKKPEHTGN
jgi:hypothetical protein